MDNKYEYLKTVGEGTFGKVYQGLNRMTGELVALKKVTINKTEGLPATSVKEIATLKSLQHPNIVKLIHAELTDTELTYVFEFCDGDLLNCMRSCNNSLEPNTVLSFMHQILTGMAYCHGKNIIHRDLKPANLLISSNRKLKIADFGLARQTNLPVKTLSSNVTTLWYRAPEILLGSGSYGPPIDLWSIGCIFAEMIFGRPLFLGQKELDQLHIVFQNLGTPSYSEMKEIFRSHHGIKDVALISLPHCQGIPFFVPHTYPDNARELLERLLKIDPEARGTAMDALRHSYFRGIRSTSSKTRQRHTPVNPHAERVLEHVGTQSQASSSTPPIYSQQQHQPATNYDQSIYKLNPTTSIPTQQQNHTIYRDVPVPNTEHSSLLPQYQDEQIQRQPSTRAPIYTQSQHQAPTKYNNSIYRNVTPPEQPSSYTSSSRPPIDSQQQQQATSYDRLINMNQTTSIPTQQQNQTIYRNVPDPNTEHSSLPPQYPNEPIKRRPSTRAPIYAQSQHQAPTKYNNSIYRNVPPEQPPSYVNAPTGQQRYPESSCRRTQSRKQVRFMITPDKP